MKKVSLTVTSILLSRMLIAQDYTPPSNANAKFKEKYPQGVVDEWFDNDEEIVCYFEIDNNYGSAHFSSKGIWLRSEFSISESELPSAVMTIITNKYADYELTDVSKIDTPKGLKFGVYLFNPTSENDYRVTISESGKIISEEDLNADDSFE